MLRLTGRVIVIVGSMLSLYAFFMLVYNSFSGSTGYQIAMTGCSGFACRNEFHLFGLEPVLAVVTSLLALFQMRRQNNGVMGKAILLISATAFVVLVALFYYDSQINCFLGICADVFYGWGMKIYPL